MKLYEALVLPVLDFGATVITSSLAKCSNEFGKIQRCAMLKSSGCRNSTTTDALEILTNTPTVDLHLKLWQAQEMVRLCAKHDEDPLRTDFNTWLRYTHQSGRKPTLFQLLMSQFRETEKYSSTQKS